MSGRLMIFQDQIRDQRTGIRNILRHSKKTGDPERPPAD